MMGSVVCGDGVGLGVRGRLLLHLRRGGAGIHRRHATRDSSAWAAAGRRRRGGQDTMQQARAKRAWALADRTDAAEAVHCCTHGRHRFRRRVRECGSRHLQALQCLWQCGQSPPSYL